MYNLTSYTYKVIRLCLIYLTVYKQPVSSNESLALPAVWLCLITSEISLTDLHSVWSKL